MAFLRTWFFILSAVLVALSANSISAVWASKEEKFSTIWFLALLIVSPLVFITFGLVTSKLGLSMTSAIVDSLLTISTILVGLFIFGEWSNVSMYQLVGILLSISGIVLMQLHN
ncbi:MAG: hypothetical protein A3C62_01635 [Candidatus Zambryskibacteria bacterium RIFCSPHIGHO2_02_FULL_39_16]|uniref:EamA domain-containing protein n=1 Tax=Candidatus Zambryskibacteria bacterium RIFCSPLOWO2_02_FULL_39_14 TaxID=1802769 RepID=A0A1G2UFW6_9BACT|nr:MAG: hypothetical protein A3C62_01635 [Candidatus Zambryskibacteria bacterium RIFCSPHIGHO2_02_FULL_39_16]OHB08030.1 MAG: hypothetical protein A3I86_01470 [Candidatus Zambryskibacteria bacterium RIFCSPLOWO2_02_FULL_39_14]